MLLCDLLPVETSVDRQSAFAMLADGRKITVTFHKNLFSDDGFYIWDVEGQAENPDLYAHLHHDTDGVESEISCELGFDASGLEWQLPMASMDAFAGWIVDALEYLPVPDEGKPVLNALIAMHKRLVEEQQEIAKA